jgi:hypothetical protein
MLTLGGRWCLLVGCFSVSTGCSPVEPTALNRSDAIDQGLSVSQTIDPEAVEARIRNAYLLVNTPDQSTRDQPQSGSPVTETLLVAMQASDDDSAEQAEDKPAEAQESDAAAEESDAEKAKEKPAEKPGNFDGEFDASEIDASEDATVEPSASDWRNAEVVPTPLAQPEIAAEVVPTPLGLPEKARVARKPPVTPRSRADVTEVASPSGAPLIASPVVASPTIPGQAAGGADGNPQSDTPRIAASPKDAPRNDSGGLNPVTPNVTGDTVEMLDQAATKAVALPADGMVGPVDFKKWPIPDVTVFVTGQQHGYIEPCGCTGLENQKGGVARRMTFATDLRELGWELLPVDAGNLVRRFGRQAEIKYHRSLEALRAMGYVAVGFGPDDVRISAGDLIQEAAAENPEDAIYTSANVVVYDSSLMPPPFKIEQRGGIKVAVTSVLDPASLETQLSDEIIMGDPVDSAKKVLEQISTEAPDYVVMTFYGKEEAAAKLVREVPGIDLIVVAGGYGEPTYQPQAITDSKTKMILTGNKGMYVGLVGLYKDAEMRYARVPLDDSFGDAPEMRQLMADYQFQLRDLGLENLGLKPVQHPTGEKFVGSATCGDCHTTAYEIWENSPHFDATESLVHPGERGDVPRHFDPECISCHVTGWNPQNYYPYVSGYLNLEADKHLHGNGCENCHGPGASHAAAENGEIDITDEQRQLLRDAMKLPLEKAREKCMECHDLDNSPDFHKEGAFEDYWAEVEHYGVD